MRTFISRADQDIKNNIKTRELLSYYKGILGIALYAPYRNALDAWAACLDPRFRLLHTEYLHLLRVFCLCWSPTSGEQWYYVNKILLINWRWRGNNTLVDYREHLGCELHVTWLTKTISTCLTDFWSVLSHNKPYYEIKQIPVNIQQAWDVLTRIHILFTL